VLDCSCVANVACYWPRQAGIGWEQAGSCGVRPHCVTGDGALQAAAAAVYAQSKTCGRLSAGVDSSSSRRSSSRRSRSRLLQESGCWGIASASVAVRGSSNSILDNAAGGVTAQAAGDPSAGEGCYCCQACEAAQHHVGSAPCHGTVVKHTLTRAVYQTSFCMRRTQRPSAS